MKTVCALALASLLSACGMFPVNNANNPREDGLAKPSPEAGPTLCTDGTAPPCTPRS